MATVIDLLRSRGLGAGPGGAQALCGPIAIASEPARAITLAAPGALVTAWTALTGRPPEASHAVALAASRVDETVAFVGHGQAVHHDLLLLNLAQLGADMSSAALWLVPDARSARAAAGLWDAVSSSTALTWQLVGGRAIRPLPTRVVIATYDELHQRLLSGADRGWRWLWPRLRFVVAPDLQRASGAVSAHLSWLNRRVERLAEHDLSLMLGSTPIAEPEETFGRLLGQPIRAVVSRVPNSPALVALWHTVDRWTSMRMLAAELLARRLGVALLGRDERETQALRSGLAALPASAIGLPPDKARIAIVSGVPHDQDQRDGLLRRGYRLLIIVAGDDPFEALYADQPGMLLAAPPALAVTRGNAYVAGAHLQWAAGEAPLRQPELARWDAQPLMELLLDRGLLRMVAADQIQPADGALEHGLELVTATIGEPPFEVRDPEESVVTRLLAHVADWWAMPGTTWLPGSTIGEHDVDATSATLAPAPEAEVVLPLLSVELSLRDELGPFPARVGARTVAVTRAKVHVKQRIEGQMIFRAGKPGQERLLDRSRLRGWDAHACAIGVPVAPAEPRIAGWSLGLALPQIVRLTRGDALVAYDGATHAIWIIETHPGGAGLVACIVDDVPRLISMAVALARAARTSPIYGALARSELAWLEPLHQPDDAIARAPGIAQGDFTPTRIHIAKGSHDTPDEPVEEQTGGFFDEVVLEDAPTPPRGTLKPKRQATITPLRRVHEQTGPHPPALQSADRMPAADTRFQRGQRVRCVPYGEGIVRDARIVAGREQLTIAFAGAGDIDVDPAVSLVRTLDESPKHADPWDSQIF